MGAPGVHPALGVAGLIALLFTGWLVYSSMPGQDVRQVAGWDPGVAEIASVPSPETGVIAGAQNGSLVIEPPGYFSRPRSIRTSGIDAGQPQRANYFDMFDFSELTPAVAQIPSALESLEPYYRYTSELPGIGAWTSGLNYTVRLIRNSIEPEAEQHAPIEERDFGRRRGPDDLAARVLA